MSLTLPGRLSLVRLHLCSNGPAQFSDDGVESNSPAGRLRLLESLKNGSVMYVAIECSAPLISERRRFYQAEAK